MIWDDAAIRRAHRHGGRGPTHALAVRRRLAGLLRHVRAAGEPRRQPATSRVMRSSPSAGAAVTRTFDVRADVAAHRVRRPRFPNWSGKSFSIVVESSTPIIAERAMYFGTDAACSTAGTSRRACRTRRATGSSPRGRPARSSTPSSSSATRTPAAANVDVHLPDRQRADGHADPDDRGQQPAHGQRRDARSRRWRTSRCRRRSPRMCRSSPSARCTGPVSPRPGTRRTTASASRRWARSGAWRKAAWAGGRRSRPTSSSPTRTTTAAQVEVTFLRTDGTTVVKTYTVQPTSRFNMHVNTHGAGARRTRPSAR